MQRCTTLQQAKTTLHASTKLVMFAVNLCRNVWVLGSTKVGRHWIFTEIMCIVGSRKLCKECTTSQQEKKALHACKQLVMFAVNLCKNVWVLRSKKVGRHFEISQKLCSLLALESCAKGAQHHNKQNTTVHACKKLVMFDVNLCRNVWFLRITKVGIHFEISLELCALLALESCAKGAQHHNKQKTTLQAC